MRRQGHSPTAFCSRAWAKVGVRDLVARGYSIPGGVSQRGGGQARMFPCRTLSDPARGQSWIGWLGPDRPCQGTPGSHGVPYWSVHQSYTNTEQSSHPSGLDGVCRTMSGFRQVSVGTLTWHDGTCWGSMGRSTVPYRCTIDVRIPWAHLGVPTGRLGPRRPPAARRRPCPPDFS